MFAFVAALTFGHVWSVLVSLNHNRNMIRGFASLKWRRRDAQRTFGTLPCCSFLLHEIENVRVHDQDELHPTVIKSTRMYHFQLTTQFAPHFGGFAGRRRRSIER